MHDGLIDPVGDLKMLPFLAVADLIYGELSPDMERALQYLAFSRKYIYTCGLSRFELSRFLPTRSNRTLREFETKWKAFSRMAYQCACDPSLTKAPIFQLFDALYKGTLSAEYVHHNLDEALYADLDVTMGALSWKLDSGI
ncbi:uncharacterized protein N7529_005415 [Penicillium soppii]|uniref:uncharacterized protein n=1 Tax=Penicillium soppii TaxID=69789 RepID=UPI0025477D41|nr:uncharacterized protein N7529_005415 [Penicillium soppii]KAJ5873062.1 hypothetical protein N7529_005415 [Penicillium soppii]